jgi:hypothetical protein
MVKLILYNALAILQLYLGTLLTILVLSLLYLLVLLSFLCIQPKKVGRDHAIILF